MNVISLIGPAKASYRYEGLAALATRRSIFAIWSERMRFRWDLQRMASANPHLIDDIGLTKRQVEAEIAKPFWQA